LLDEHTGRLNGVANSGYSRKLDAVMAQPSGHVVTQTGSQNDARVSTRAQYALRKELLRAVGCELDTVDGAEYEENSGAGGA
jgi:hypothetical protein